MQKPPRAATHPSAEPPVFSDMATGVPAWAPARSGSARGDGDTGHRSAAQRLPAVPDLPPLIAGTQSYRSPAPRSKPAVWKPACDTQTSCALACYWRGRCCSCRRICDLQSCLQAASAASHSAQCRLKSNTPVITDLKQPNLCTRQWTTLETYKPEEKDKRGQRICRRTEALIAANTRNRQERQSAASWHGFSAKQA